MMSLDTTASTKHMARSELHITGLICDVTSNKDTSPHVQNVNTISHLQLSHMAPSTHSPYLTNKATGSLSTSSACSQKMKAKNCLITFTDRLGSDIQLVPTRTDITAEDLMYLFFNKWYCKNGLPTDIFRQG